MSGLIDFTTPSLLQGIAFGVYPGVDGFNKFGRNDNIGTGSTPEDVWGGGGVYTGFSDTAPERLSIVSDNANDAEGGTGARTYRLFGLERPDSKQYTQEDIALNGTTPVLTARSYYRMNRAYILTAGSSETNEGRITARHETTTANIMSVMPAERGQTQIAPFSIPANNIGFIDEIRVSIIRSSGAAGSGQCLFQTRSNIGQAWRTRQLFDLQTGGVVDEKFDIPLRLAAPPDHPLDIRPRVTTVSDNNTRITFAFSGFYCTANILNKLILNRLGLDEDSLSQSVEN